MISAPLPLPRATLEPMLEEYQGRLEAAAARGRDAYDREFDDPPAGLGAHEIDSEMRLRRVNRGSLAILGYPGEQLLGRRVLDFIVMRETSRRAIDRKLGGGAQLKPFVRSFLRADGTSITMLLLDRHLRDEQGKAVGLRTVYAPVELGG